MENASGKSEKGFDVGALVVAVIAITTMLVVYLLPPQLTFFNHRLVVMQGIIVPGLLVGALLWSVIKICTSRGNRTIDVILRPLLGFVIGVLLGAILGISSTSDSTSLSLPST